MLSYPRVFPRHARVLPKRLQDVQAATVRLYNAASAHMITLGHGCSDDMTRQDGTTTLAMFNTAGW
jgi:prolyl oligopeptidase PreP (S9A serine peptidase family)